MKLRLFFYFLIFNLSCFAQKKQMSYFFDYYSKRKINQYETGTKGEIVYFSNKQDSTYNLSISITNTKNEAVLIDKKKDIIVKFDVNLGFINNDTVDLTKLTNSKLYTIVIFGPSKKYKKMVQDFEYEKNTITNKSIFHLTRFKNNKRNKIISEHYYFFEKDINNSALIKNSVKEYIAEKYKIKFDSDDNLKRILHLKNGELANETEFLETKNINYNFIFEIDEEFPKMNFIQNTTK
ncbi:MAG: hypothetical protein ACI9XR_000500 [Flavobacterium sp.]|jgi:hypothetical protein